MKRKQILVTQRVEIHPNIGERRDCVDQRLMQFLYACGFLPLPVPNIPEIAVALLEQTDAEGLFFSGGNSLEICGGDAPERDQTERMLLAQALPWGLPVFGICRGLQLIVTHYGGKLTAVKDHVAVRHRITGDFGRREVNSYHTWACRVPDLPPSLRSLAFADDGTVEALSGTGDAGRVGAVLWHPERETPFQPADIRLVKNFFDTGELCL